MITSRILDEVRKDSHSHPLKFSVLVDTGGPKETIVGRNAIGNHTERASAPEIQETFWSDSSKTQSYKRFTTK